MRLGNPDPIEYGYCDKCGAKVWVEYIQDTTCVYCLEEGRDDEW